MNCRKHSQWIVNSHKLRASGDLFHFISQSRLWRFSIKVTKDPSWFTGENVVQQFYLFLLLLQFFYFFLSSRWKVKSSSVPREEKYLQKKFMKESVLKFLIFLGTFLVFFSCSRRLLMRLLVFSSPLDPRQKCCHLNVSTSALTSGHHKKNRSGCPEVFSSIVVFLEYSKL